MPANCRFLFSGWWVSRSDSKHRLRSSHGLWPRASVRNSSLWYSLSLLMPFVTALSSLLV